MKPNPYQSPLYPGHQPQAMVSGLDNLRAVKWVEGLGKLQILHSLVQAVTSIAGVFFLYPGKVESHGPIIVCFLLLILFTNLLASQWVSQFKGRLFCLTTLLLGLSQMLTVFAALPSLCVSAFGLFLLFHPAVRQAFAMREQGISKQEILNHFEAAGVGDSPMPVPVTPASD